MGVDSPTAEPIEARETSLRHNRDFTKLWIGQALSTVGSRSSYVAYPLIVLALTGSAAQAGLVGFLRQLPLFLFQLPAGALADRYDRRRLMMACDAGRALAMGSLGGALLLGRATLVQILVVAFVEGALNVAFAPAQIGAIKQIVPARELPGAIAANEARDNAAYLVGPSLGGVLFSVARAAPFVADAVSYLVSLVTLVFIRRPFQEPRTSPLRPLHREIAEGLAWIWRQPFLRAALLLAGGSNLVSNALALLIILVARERGASAVAIGVMLTLVAVGGLTGALLAPSLVQRLPQRLIVVGLPWLYAALIPTFAFVPGPLGLGAIFGLMTFLGPAWNAIVGGYAIAITPDRLQARRSSVDWLVSGAGVAVAPLLAGLLLAGVGATAAIGAFAAVAFAIALGGTSSRALRSLTDD
jgi:MFS family permease